MRRRRLLLSLLLPALGLFVVLAMPAFAPPEVRPPPSTPGVTRENYERIRPGMTEAQVNAIFSQPPSCDYLGPILRPEDRYTGKRLTKQWFGKYGTAAIQFYDGQVEVSGFSPEQSAPFFDRLRDWLGW
jgi:hypothetical protein